MCLENEIEAALHTLIENETNVKANELKSFEELFKLFLQFHEIEECRKHVNEVDYHFDNQYVAHI